MKHLTPEDKQYVLRRHQEGASLRGIGREIGRPDITVRRTLEAAGVTFGPPKTTNKRSSPETEAHVMRLYDAGRTWKEIMEAAGVTDVTVGKILQRNGREFDRKPEGTEGKTEIIAALYATGYSTRDIGRMLGHSKSTINAVVTGSGAKIRKSPGCDRPDYFDHIDTPDKAYWLGFLSADGCMITTAAHPEGDHLSVKLAARDKGHLEKLKETLRANAGVLSGVQSGFGKPMPYVSLSVSSRRLADALIALGINPRKSATVEPWNGPEHLMPHFWRGLFDGDGSFAIKSATLFTAFLCGSEPCVRGFTAWAHGITGTTATPYFRTGCWYVSISGRYQVPKLVRAMAYDYAPVSLDRKQVRADAILAADGPRKKPGPASRFATEEERLANTRRVRREAQCRYVERKRQAKTA
jgi:transposase-like protein